MYYEKARAHLQKYGLADRIKLFDVSSATVALAAKALGTEESRIAKTLSFMTEEGPILIVMAGDCKVDNGKYKATFNKKAKMLAFDEVESLIGYPVGGVCPFGVNEGVRVFLDESLKRFDIIYPAAGTAKSGVELTLDELRLSSMAISFVDVSKPCEEND